MKILKINSSVNFKDSISRGLVDKVVSKLSEDSKTEIIDRDLAKGVSLLTQEMLDAFYEAPNYSKEAAAQKRKESNTYIDEIKEADILVFGVPIYNFSVPASVKAYFDLIARAGVTFKYSEQGPEGLLKDKTAIVIVISGGTKFKSKDDFASNYIEHFLNFIGIEDVRFIIADRLAFDRNGQIQQAEKQISEIA